MCPYELGSNSTFNEFCNNIRQFYVVVTYFSTHGSPPNYSYYLYFLEYANVTKICWVAQKNA